MVQNLSQSIQAQFSNHIWRLDFSVLKFVVENENGTVIGYPLLTVISDVYSSCVAGYNLSFKEPNPEVVVAAMQHAVLRKKYPLEYHLSNGRAIYGLPQVLMWDAHKVWDSSNFIPLHHILNRNGIHLIRRKSAPSAGTDVERFLGSCAEFLIELLGEHLPAGESHTRLTSIQLDQLLARYIIESYNQSIHSCYRNETRLQRWQAGLTANPQILSEKNFEVSFSK